MDVAACDPSRAGRRGRVRKSDSSGSGGRGARAASAGIVRFADRRRRTLFQLLFERGDRRLVRSRVRGLVPLWLRRAVSRTVRFARARPLAAGVVAAATVVTIVGASAVVVHEHHAHAAVHVAGPGWLGR